MSIYPRPIRLYGLLLYVPLMLISLYKFYTMWLYEILTYIFSFVDHDMFMRFRGGGVGHKMTRDLDELLQSDCTIVDPAYADNIEVDCGTLEVLEGSDDVDEDEDSDGEGGRDDDDCIRADE